MANSLRSSCDKVSKTVGNFFVQQLDYQLLRSVRQPPGPGVIERMW
jgi:hypothetical protein